jgi:DHA1 family bicyclomycin/chloramphenicol resistance-like MFS transporter
MVISRAVVSDKCDAVGSAKVFSQLMLVMGLAPILAPMLGGLLVNLYGWQSIFVGLTLFSALAATAVALWLPESLPAHVPRQPLSGALRQYGRLLTDSVFLGHALTGGIAIAGMFAYIAGSPFVFIKLYGVPAEHFGWLFGTNAAGFILVAQVNARLLSKRGPAFLLARAVWVYWLAGLSLLAVSALQPERLWPLLIPLFICIASLGCIIPNASACAMNGQGARAGSASAMLGCLQFSVAAGAAALVAALHDGTAVPMAIVISLCGLLVVSAAMLTRRLQNARALAQAGRQE